MTAPSGALLVLWVTHCKGEVKRRGGEWPARRVLVECLPGGGGKERRGEKGQGVRRMRINNTSTACHPPAYHTKTISFYSTHSVSMVSLTQLGQLSPTGRLAAHAEETCPSLAPVRVSGTGGGDKRELALAVYFCLLKSPQPAGRAIHIK